MDLWQALDLGSAVVSVPPLAVSAYLAVLAASSGRRAAPAYGSPRTRFEVIVPAHDEQDGIAATVQSLRAVDYPHHLFRVTVVADNCTDETASRAREAGADVTERVDPERRGKGFALAHAFAASLARGDVDAVVVVDADTTVTANLLRAFDERLSAGEGVVQARYGVRNPAASWRTRLIAVALTLFHDVRSLARERLALSCGLRGNGMAFAIGVLRRVPYDSFSLVEDVEYGIKLGESGQRVAYVDHASVLGEMVSGETASRPQRRRWEMGRKELRRAHGWRLLARGLRQRSAMVADLGMDLLVPPLTTIALWGAAGVAVSSALAFELHESQRTPVSIFAWGLVALCLAAYVLRGVQLSKSGARALLDLAWAPAYVAWKLALSAGSRRRRPQGWVRTTRERSE